MKNVFRNALNLVFLSLFTPIHAQQFSLSCPDNNHPHAIDLGTGVKWACCNVGAPSPMYPGDFFSWGETESKSYYDENHYKYYSTSTGHIPIASDISGTEYDVAHVKWGDNWKMPNNEQIKKLIDKCKKHEVTINGVPGTLFVGPNGASIFFPNSGIIYSFNEYRDNISYRGTDGFYWSSICPNAGNGSGFNLRLSGECPYIENNWKRCCGLTIRPVGELSEEYKEPETTTSFCPDDNHPHMIDLALPSGNLWACCNLGSSKPEEPGALFSWGEVYTKTDYSHSTYLIFDNIGNKIEYKDGYTYYDISGTKYDAARMHWGQEWKMASLFDYEELIDNTKYEFINYKGHDGVKFTGKNGNSIFIDISQAYDGCIWTSTSNRVDASGLDRVFNKMETHYYHKWEGNQIRAIASKTTPLCPDDNHPHAIDMGLPSGVKWSCCNVGSTKPEDYGGFYSWGELEEKQIYNIKNYKNRKKPIRQKISGTEKDVAHVMWGDGWMIPEKGHFEELKNYTKQHSLYINDVYGILFQSIINGNRLFIPFTGLKDDERSGWMFPEYGNLWTGDLSSYVAGDNYLTISGILFSRDGGNVYKPFYFNSRPEREINIYFEEPHMGMPIRPIYK